MLQANKGNTVSLHTILYINTAINTDVNVPVVLGIDIATTVVPACQTSCLLWQWGDDTCAS